ncbi:hypothetical protein V5O48_012950 [Marasmius crinis-equi]|uniref:Uncharacterized protein n=1 Tax=Marasmius crinis-equi TaxID=585013 RepID=A0ABR3F1G0_9AGAR
MPILTPSNSPPPVPASQMSNGVQIGSISSQRSGVVLPVEDESRKPRIPTVRLDVPIITDSIAARLATTLLNHVLFLKNQVPLPVVILHKQRQTNTKADKPRLELLNTLDILSSHLDTTFTALSSAYARCNNGTHGPRPSRPTHLAILIGPSISTARAKVIFGVDGLEEKVWGLRDDFRLGHENDPEDEDESEEEAESEGEEESDDDDGSEEDDSEEEGDDNDEDASVDGEDPPNSDTDGDDDDDDDDGKDEQEYADANPQPLSIKSQSPPPMQNSPTQSKLQSQRPHASTRPQQVQPQSYAELQAILHKADRLFSNTLARAEGEGHGMSAELAPTQTHILLRAPRRFKHPAWIPRQNMDRIMERVVSEFDEARSIQSLSNENVQTRRGLKGRSEKDKSKVEGVWVTSTSLPSENTSSHPTNITQDAGLKGDSSLSRTDDEQNEMIWWSWEREVVGFN